MYNTLVCSDGVCFPTQRFNAKRRIRCRNRGSKVLCL